MDLFGVSLPLQSFRLQLHKLRSIIVWMLSACECHCCCANLLFYECPVKNIRFKQFWKVIYFLLACSSVWKKMTSVVHLSCHLLYLTNICALVPLLLSLKIILETLFKHVSEFGCVLLLPFNPVNLEIYRKPRKAGTCFRSY